MRVDPFPPNRVDGIDPLHANASEQAWKWRRLLRAGQSAMERGHWGESGGAGVERGGARGERGGAGSEHRLCLGASARA